MVRNSIRSFAIGLLLVIGIVVIANVVDLGADWLKGDRFEAEASPIATETPYGLDLVGCEEHVCIYSFPNGRLPSDGAYCYLAIGTSTKLGSNSAPTVALVCP